MTPSIRFRLTAWYSLVVVAVLVTGAVAVAMIQQRLAVERLDREMRRQMLTLQGVMRTEFSEGLDLQAAADEASIEVVAPDRTLVLVRPDGVLLAMWGHPFAPNWRPRQDSATLETIDVRSGRVRLLSEPVMHQRERYVAAVIAPLEQFDAEHAELLLALGAGVLIALAVAAAGGWIVGHQTLRPLSVMATQARSISERDLAARLHTKNSHDEIGQFATAFNGVLDRLASALQGQRQFMADASHELRTPASVIRTTAQVTLAGPTRPENEYRESLAIVAEQSARLNRVVDAMFLLSRAEANAVPLVPEHLYVDDVVEECARALRVVADDRRVSVLTQGDTEVAFHGYNILLRQMVGNLLENAIRHASPAGRVAATVSSTPELITIRITDDGDGIPDHERHRIFQRFVRLDTRSPGAGLGLPIARWIAEAHSGSLVLESSGRAGSCFVVSLPRA
jgi:two-component system, OmpR family, sensor kinase